MRRHPLAYTLVYLFPVLWVTGATLGGWYHYLVLIAGYLVVPLADLITGPRPSYLSFQESRSLAEDPRYRWLLYAYLPVVYILMIWACYFVSQTRMSFPELTGFVLSSAVITGAIGMTVAHELCHNPGKTDQLVARGILVHVCYMHFVIEHIYGHHVKVATPDDPATARAGESLYTFYFRSVIGGFRSALQLEKKRLQRNGSRIYGPKNQMLWFILIPALFTTCLGILFGIKGVAFFLAQAVVGFSYLEVINYVEHYGLLRKKREGGRYEKVSPRHSWNSDHPVSNLFLFGLPTHSDHHANSVKPYQALSSVPDAPQLPFSYSIMVTLAFFPTIWRKIMDRRVAEYN